MQIKTMVHFHCTPIRMAKNLDHQQHINAGEIVEQRELSSIPSETATWYRHFGRQLCGFLQE